MKITSLILISITSILIAQAEEKQPAWMASFFKMNPEADTDGDGKLSWYEFAEQKKVLVFGKKGKKVPKVDADKVAQYLKKFPASDANKDGKLSWTEIKKYQKSNADAQLELPQQ